MTERPVIIFSDPGSIMVELRCRSCGHYERRSVSLREAVSLRERGDRHVCSEGGGERVMSIMDVVRWTVKL